MTVVPGWPAVLRDGAVTLRPLRVRDAAAWVDSRKRNVEWLRPWEATPPGGSGIFASSRAVFVSMARRLRAEARAGRGLPFAVEVDGAFAGQLNVSGIVRGSLESASIGYWVDQRVAGRGVMPTCVALATDHCFTAVGLHRIEINIRPENAPSRRVVEKLGFRLEGTRERFLHISGDWRDHLAYALVREDVPGGLLARWNRVRDQVGDTPA
ncbi:MAG TPA: GNAT family protein [Mycobacteriales bacterium]|nr:GNAT family protein [Mycobacteriales bacterium]